MTLLNLQDDVRPNHWRIEQFSPWGDTAPAAEFDLIASILIYFQIDFLAYNRAKAAWKKLQKGGHAMTIGQSFERCKNNHMAPLGLANRYNALFMHLVHTEAQACELEAVFDICEFGSFIVAVGDDEFSGDSSGMFAVFTSSSALLNRISTQ